MDMNFIAPFPEGRDVSILGYEYQVGDVLVSSKYPNFTGLAKESLISITRWSTFGSAQFYHYEEGKDPSNSYKELKIEWVRNGYLIPLGVDKRREKTEYVLRMCMTLGFDVQQLPPGLFAKLLEMEKGQINAALFDIKEARDAATLSERDIRNVVSVVGMSRDSGEASTLEQLADNYTELARLRERIVRRQRMVAENINRLQQLNDDKFIATMAEKVNVGIQEVIAGGWYTLHSISDCVIRFTTATVTLRYIDRDYVMGTYLVEYNPVTSEINVLEHTNNVYAGSEDSYIHPHVNYEGSICWGNALDAYTRAAAAWDIPKIFTMLRGVLTVYNSDSPYVDISGFNDGQLTNNRYHAWIKDFGTVMFRKDVAIPWDWVQTNMPQVTDPNVAFVYAGGTYLGFKTDVWVTYKGEYYVIVNGVHQAIEHSLTPYRVKDVYYETDLQEALRNLRQVADELVDMDSSTDSLELSDSPTF